MKSFDLFAGYGGFTKALEKIYGDSKLQQGQDGEGNNLPYQEGQDIQCPETTIRKSTAVCIGFSEIDKYASAVLKYHWPNTKNYGDIAKINWGEVPDFDLLTGGSPCQDLSIAGKRAGLSGERSGLFYEYMRAVREKKPKYFIWENVKGALSSRSGWDFTAVINEMAETGYSLWWQVLNAKDFGVPQNRERIFVVGFRDGSPREIFFEREGNGKADINIVGSTNNSGRGERARIFGESGICSGLTATDYKQPKQILQLNNPTHSNNRLYSDEGISPSLNTAQGGNRQPKIVRPILTPDRLNKRQNGRRFKEDGEPSFTLNCQDRHGVMLEDILERKKDSLGRNMPLHRAKPITNNMKIRRLTPTECERLMGLPDGWTSKGILNDELVSISDSQRYKLCGNGVVVNVVEAIIKNIIL